MPLLNLDDTPEDFVSQRAAIGVQGGGVGMQQSGPALARAFGSSRRGEMRSPPQSALGMSNHGSHVVCLPNHIFVAIKY